MYLSGEGLGLDFGHVVEKNDPHSVLCSPDNEIPFFRSQKSGGRGKIYHHHSRGERIDPNATFLLYGGEKQVTTLRHVRISTPVVAEPSRICYKR